MKLAEYIINPAVNQPGELGGWPMNGDSFFNHLKQEDSAQLAYKRVDIAVASHKITVVPTEFSAEDSLSVIMPAAHVVVSGEEIISEKVYDSGPVVAILIPDYIREQCATIYPGSFLHVGATMFVKGVMQATLPSGARQVFINLYSSYFEISVIQGSRLLYLNAFRYAAPSDVLYFVIFVLEQLGFVPSEEKVILMGDISVESPVFEQLKMYCASLDLSGRPSFIQSGNSFSGIEAYRYFTLMNLPSCE